MLESSDALRHLHSFPTRRSSDLSELVSRLRSSFLTQAACDDSAVVSNLFIRSSIPRHAQFKYEWSRSEEHTSELQSHSDIVCRLLLEKKKNDDDTEEEPVERLRL